MESSYLDCRTTSPELGIAECAFEVGAHIVTEREGYTHHGIYAGNGRVIHYGGFHHCAQRRPIEYIPLHRFAAGRGIKVRSEPNAIYTGIDAVERARSRLGEDRYRLLSNNCEHFCTWCVSGVGHSEQVRRCMRNPWQGIKTLFALAREECMMGRKMSIQSNIRQCVWRALKPGVVMFAAALSACVNYADIHGDAKMAEPQQYATRQSLPAQQGHWPAANWADQFGDAQLKALIEEALKSSPTLEQARARVGAASAYSETAKASTMPRVDANYSLTRQRFSSTTFVPPPFGGSWQTENKGLLSASYDLDLWGKNREALKAAISLHQASRADAEVVKLTLTTSIARTYNQLARLYVLRDIAQEEIAHREQIERITAGRIATGLDTEVERKTAQANLATSRAALKSLDGRILAVRYEIAALLGAGPDRGLQIARPTLGMGDDVRLPDNLPADLLSRRPEIVAARWRVDAMTHDVNEAKAEFYPDINLSAAIGLDAFGFGRFLTAASRTASVGPAIHLPIFDAGELRAQLKGRYADFDYAVATYNQSLVSALNEVAKQLADVRSTDAQLADAQIAQDAAHQADKLALIQYKAGLTNQLTVLNADVAALSADQAVADLRMNRRDQQIALASALGGGFVDTSSQDSAAASRTQASALQTPVVAAR